MGNIENLSYEDYDKITDILMFLSTDITLKFSVMLSRNMSKNDKSRKHIHSECTYTSKYIGTDQSISIIRQMLSYYFLIDIKNDFMGSIVLRPGDIEILKMLINQKILPWFFGNNTAFQITDGKLHLANYGKPVMFTQNDYKYIGFTPIVITYDDGQSKQGLRMNFNNQDTYCDIDIDTFMNFVNIIKCTDMYNAACNLVNYVKMPPYGLNQFSAGGLGSARFKDDINKTRNNNFLDNAKKKS